jgi:salicylate hydroxylase
LRPAYQARSNDLQQGQGWNKLIQDVLIAGGGIGGLTAALCFAKRGARVQVFEAAPQFGEVGAGIQLTPNCTRVLHDLGLQSALRHVAFLPEAVEIRDWKSGRLLSSNPLGAQVVTDYGFPYYHIHRADLMQVLVAAAEAQSNIALHTSASVDDIESIDGGDDGVSVQVGGARYDGGLLVGADGIQSTVRATLFGAQAATFTGNVAWRGLVPADRLPANLVRPVAGVWLGPHKHFVHYFVRAGEMVNCVCVVEKAGWEVESWTERGDHTELKTDFAGWHETIQVLIDHMDPEQCFKWALFDRPPKSRWSSGRVTLLGDACHPTLPFLAQGAAMAIEDGAVLAACIAQGGDVSERLRQYESLRRPRTERIRAGSRRNAKIFHMTGIQAWLRNQVVGRAGGKLMHGLYNYNALDQVP